MEGEHSNEVGHVQKAKEEKGWHVTQEPINTVQWRGGSRRLPEWKVTVRDWCLCKVLAAKKSRHRE